MALAGAQRPAAAGARVGQSRHAAIRLRHCCCCCRRVDRRVTQAVQALCERPTAGCQGLAVQQHRDEKEELVLTLQQAVQGGAALRRHRQAVHHCRLEAGHQPVGRHQLEKGGTVARFAAQRHKRHGDVCVGSGAPVPAACRVAASASGRVGEGALEAFPPWRSS